MDSKDKEIAQLTKMNDDLRQSAARSTAAKDVEIAALRDLIGGLEQTAEGFPGHCAVNGWECVRCWIISHISQGLQDVEGAIMSELAGLDYVDRMRLTPESEDLDKLVGKTVLRIAKKRE